MSNVYRMSVKPMSDVSVLCPTFVLPVCPVSCFAAEWPLGGVLPVVRSFFRIVVALLVIKNCCHWPELAVDLVACRPTVHFSTAGCACEHPISAFFHQMFFFLNLLYAAVAAVDLLF